MQDHNIDRPAVRRVLYLINNRLIQQNERIAEAIQSSRNAHKGKPFKPLTTKTRFCESRKVLFLSIDPNTGKAYSIKTQGIPCKQWACANCGPKKAIILKYELIHIAVQYNLDHFLTITLAPSVIPPEYKNNTGKYIAYLFNRYRLAITRKFKRDLLYIWVKQYQKNGNAHLHILLHGFLPVKYLRREWKRIGGGTEIVIKYLKTEKDIERVSRYVTNYLLDGVTEGYGFIYGERRYGIAQKCKIDDSAKISVEKLDNIADLSKFISSKDILLAKNMLYNPDNTTDELIIEPHQEKLL